MSAIDLDVATAAISDARQVIDACAKHLAGNGGVEANQVVAYDLAHAAAAAECAAAAVEYGRSGDTEARLAAVFVADAMHDVATRLLGREEAWGTTPGALDKAVAATSQWRDPAFLSSLAGEQGDRHLDDEMAMVADTFRRFADEKVRAVAEHIHRTNGDIPEDVIRGIAELGAFGLSVPEEYGGWAMGGENEYLSMVVATEELSRGSLGAGGSLITRPEILARALVKGGTEEQKHEWLPKLASGEVMAAVAVTEPDFGSDSACRRYVRHEGRRRLRGQRRQDVVHVRRRAPTPSCCCARTDPDRSLNAQGPVALHRAEGARRRPRLPASRRRAAASSRAARSTPSATAACTPTSWPSRTGASRRPTSIGGEDGAGPRAST